MTAELQEQFEEWLKDRPQIIKDLAHRFPPWKLYRMKSGHTAQIYSYHENGTMTVSVLLEHNPAILIERNVFGIEPDDLEVSDE